MSGDIRVTRRSFLKGTGTLIVCVASPKLGLGQPTVSLPPNLGRNPDLDTWIRVNADGSISISSGKCEIGQGIRTALAQIVADELDVAIERIHMQDVDTAHSPNEGATTGSNSVKDSGAALRVAAAEARHLLVESAAERLALPAARLSVEDGRVHSDTGRESVTYWDLLGDGRFNTRADGTVEPKSPESYRYVGTSVERLDLPAKFFGEPAFIQDLRLPGMLHARMVRSAVDAARLTGVETEAVARMPGVVAVVHDGSFLAVVAAREEQAIAAAEVLRDEAVWETVRTLPEPSEFPGLLRTRNQSCGAGSTRTLGRLFTPVYGTCVYLAVGRSRPLGRVDVAGMESRPGDVPVATGSRARRGLTRAADPVYSSRGIGMLWAQRRGRCGVRRRTDRHGSA